MKKFWKIISVVLLLSLVFVTPAFADSGNEWTPLCFSDSDFRNDCAGDWYNIPYSLSGNKDLATITVGPITEETTGVLYITFGELLECGNYKPADDNILKDNAIKLGDIKFGETKSFNFTMPDGEDVAYIYIAQKNCANCLSYIKVKFKTSCDWNMYKLIGTRYNCYLNRNYKLNDTSSKLPSRFNGTDYMYGLCALYNCDGTKRLDFEWTGKWKATCETLPPCVKCP